MPSRFRKDKVDQRRRMMENRRHEDTIPEGRTSRTPRKDQKVDGRPQSRDNLCTCIFAVLQKFRREQRFKGLDMMPIGFSVYKVDGNEGRLGPDFIASNKACARSPIFINLREVCGRFRLPPGNYVVIPSTYEPGQEGAFMVRFFSHAGIDVQTV